jgi:hypothetical protein
MVTDNLGVASLVHDAPERFPVGETLVTWTAMDVGGNTATAAQRVTVIGPPLCNATVLSNVLSVAQANPPFFADNFEDASVLDHWGSPEEENPWEIIEVGGNHVLKLEGAGIAPKAPFPTSDYFLQLRFLHREKGLRLLLRAEWGGPKYEVALTADGRTIELHRSGMEAERLGIAETSLAPGEWHELGVLLRGSDIVVILNGEAVFAVTDPDPLTGLRMVIDPDALIDDLAIWPVGKP